MISGFRKTIVTLTGGEEVPLAELLGPLPKELRKLCRTLQSCVKKLNEGTLSEYLTIGRLITEQLARNEQDPKAKGPDGYGLRFFDRLGVELDVHPRTLRATVDVFRYFGDEMDVPEFVAKGVTWTHLRLLAQISDRTKRDRLLKKTITEKLSCNDLEHLILGTEPKTRRGPGRAPAVPRNLKAALGRLRSASKAYDSIMQQALFGERFDIPTMIHSSPPDQLTPETRNVVAENVERLAEIEQVSRDAHDRLKASLAHIDAAIIAQADHEKSAVVDEHDLVGCGGRHDRSY